TFVLCQGVRGDLSDIVLGWFQRLRGGQAIFTYSGHNVQQREFDELKTQRTIANEFMRQAYILGSRRLDTAIKKEGDTKDEKVRKDKLTLYITMKTDLDERLNKKTMFEGGTRLDDIVDFCLWRAQADRLGIQLTQSSVQEILY